MLSVRNRSESIALWEIESGRMFFFSFFLCVPDDEEDVQEQHTQKNDNNLGPSYKPNEYKTVFKQHYQTSRAEGKDHKEALACWNASETKLNLLAGMSESEKKRRRFVKS